MANDCHGVHWHVDRYLEHTREVLELYRTGALSQTDAIGTHSLHLTALNTAVIEAFATRLTEVPALQPTTTASTYVHPAQCGHSAPPERGKEDLGEASDA